jgi:hypothetical protein
MQRIRKPLRLLIALCLAAATFEIAARIDDWVRFGADPLDYYGSKNLRWVDDQGLPFNRPGVRFEKWRHDEHGFRIHPDRVAADAAPGGIVCLGTSESYGLHESPGQEWPAVLGALVADDGIRVINASVVGMSPFQFIPYFERYVAGQRPALVVLLISPFSFVQSMSGGDPSAPADPQQVGRMRSACKPRLKEYSRFLPKARASFMSHLPDRWARAFAIGRQRQKSVKQGTAPGGAAPSLDAPLREHLAAYRSLMDDLAGRLRACGAEVVFTTYPNSLRIDGSLSAAEGLAGRQRWLPAYSPVGLLAISRDFAAATREHCDSMGHHLVDLEAALPKDDATFADSVHLTDVGADLAAHAILAGLAPDDQVGRQDQEDGR